MVIDRLEDWLRAGCPTTPERRAWAESYLADQAVFGLRSNFMAPADGQHEARPPITLSSKYYCARQLHYALNGHAKEDMGPRAYAKFLVGSMVEAAGTARCILAGLPVIGPKPGTAQQIRLEATIAGDRLRGSLDLVLAADLMGKGVATIEELLAYRGPVIIADWKSSNEWGFDEATKAMTAEDVERRRKKGDWPDQSPLVAGTRRAGNSFSYETQLLNYARAAEENGMRVAGLYLLYHEKGNGYEAEVPVPRWEQHAAMVDSAYAAAKSGLPDRPGWATLRPVNSPSGKCEEIDSLRCSYCPFKEPCYPGFEQKIVSGKPVWRKPKEN